jgi:tetratricopeptide (TPR) repeat protein
LFSSGKLYPADARFSLPPGFQALVNPSDKPNPHHLPVPPLIMAGKKAEEDEAKTCSPLEEGQRCAKEGKHEEAISHFDMAIRENPNSADAWLAKCNELKALERYTEALECYTTALKIDPKSCQAWIAKGNTLVKVGRQEEALECFGTARKVTTRRK